jgi:hypothetical protein
MLKKKLALTFLKFEGLKIIIGLIVHVLETLETNCICF